MVAILGPILGGIAGGAASAVAGSLFGGSSSGAKSLAQGPLAKNIKTPGFTLGVESTGRAGGTGLARIFGALGGKNSAVVLRRTDETVDTLKRLGLLSEDRAQKLGGLLEQVSPGFSQFRQAGLDRLAGSERRAIGDLRENLARRRVAGSSFASDAISRARAEFGQQRAEFEAETMLRELAETERLITARTQELQAAAARELDQANFEVQAAANFANGVNVVASNNAATLAQLQAQSAQGAGAGLAPFVNAVGGAVSAGVQSLFPPSSGGTYLGGGTVFNAPNIASP